jgi:hypothetical protein
LTAFLDEATGADDRAVGISHEASFDGVCSGVHDLSQGDVVLSQLLRIHLDVALRNTFTPDSDLGHSGHPKQARADLPIGNL